MSKGKIRMECGHIMQRSDSTELKDKYLNPLDERLRVIAALVENFKQEAEQLFDPSDTSAGQRLHLLLNRLKIARRELCTNYAQTVEGRFIGDCIDFANRQIGLNFLEDFYAIEKCVITLSSSMQELSKRIGKLLKYLQAVDADKVAEREESLEQVQQIFKSIDKELSLLIVSYYKPVRSQLDYHAYRLSVLDYSERRTDRAQEAVAA